MTDENAARSTDPTVIGESVGDDGIPALDQDFPPDQPLGVEDPSITGDGSIGRDDAAARDERLEPEMGEPADAPERSDIGGLVEADRVAGRDVEAALVASESPTAEPGAESAALHVEQAPADD